MRVGTLQTWIKRQIAVRQRLERICTSYLLFLMVMTTKHSLEEAARFSGLHKSLFSHLLKSHAKVAITTLENLSKTQARQYAKALQRVKGLPWVTYMASWGTTRDAGGTYRETKPRHDLLATSVHLSSALLMQASA